MLKKRLCVFVKLLALIGSVAALLPENQNAEETSSNLQEECASRCPDLDFNQNRTDDSTSEIGCGIRCKIEQCTKGCAAWQLALHTSCQTVCNRTQELLPPKELYCVLGCHDALNRYFQQLKAEIGIPPAPALVADSLTATSLRLEWKGIDIERRSKGLSYLVQWRYEELAETWQYCRNQSWGEDDQILVENLQPYTKYRFRVALLLKSTQHNTEPIVSAPSVVILTLAAGLPTSAPVIVRAAAVDSCRVSVSWEPGPFPNGPLLSYVLRLQGAEHSQLKDIPVSENTDHYMFQNLKPNVNYSISVTMRNGVGEGPPAVKYISTTPEPTVKDTQQPILILGGEHEVMKQGADMLDEPSTIYRTTSTIRGVAIHVLTAQLFISDSAGHVYRISILKRTPPVMVLNSNQTNFKPLSLSVDWLNSHLYVLGEVKHTTTVWQLARCNLDGKNLRVEALFLIKPSHIEVDPYNGYLFWVTRGGLYRMDLVDFNNDIKHEVQPYLILEDANLGAFTVDHTNFRLLVPHHVKNTVLSVSLDGKEVIDLRANTQQPKFKNVVSLAMANGLFYWTNGDEVLTEGYHSGQNRYFHNAYPDRSDGSFVSVNVLMDASQPVPVPVNPPTGVQAVLGAERAKVSWQAPHLLGGQGKGAWQNWNYELEIRDESSGETIHHTNITGSTYTVYNLREKSGYLIKAAAYTSAGKGPWSTEFHGRTLRDGLHGNILWSSNEGLLKSDVTGENIDTLIYKASLKDGENEYHIVDVSWFRDVLYLVGNNSALYQYNMTNHKKTKLNIHSVGSVAVDWISKKLYWANPKQQIITRANLNGSQQEPMSILAIVKELLIDSVEAYLYWSTGHAVEVARLNGQDRRYYHSDEIFNGKQVMGLTLDTENRYIYWIVRSYESGSIVYRAPTSEKIPMKHKIIAEKMSTLQHPNIQGPLCYFSQHLLWLQDDQNAVIGDLSGQNTAVINGITLSGLHMVAIMDPVLHQYPNNLTAETIKVRPDAVDVNSIRVIGTWRKFNISWDPVDNINYGTVFYEIKFADYINTNSNPEITTETSVAYNNSEQILPYSLLEVSIKAFTYWEAAHHTRKTVRSPQSVPSQPINPRAFVEYHKHPLTEKIDIFAIFRWDPPEFTNGLIKSYTVQCWYIANNAANRICDTVNIPVSNLECTVHDLIPNMTYYFQVQAYTEVGAGPYTDTIEVNTGFEHPLPQLLVATGDSVRLFDLDRKDNHTITRHIVVEVTYLASENKIYWINELQELVTADISGSNASKILTLNNTAPSLCVDWVSRNLFWAESSYKESNGNYIIKLDLTAWEAGVLQYDIIVTRNRKIVNLDISPLTGTLYWVELTKSDRGVIMQSDLFGENITPFFNHMEDCSCPYHPTVRPVIAVDNTDPENLVLYWVSLEGNLHITDLDGCACNLILSQGENKGLPLTSLTVDQVYIYWSNIQEEKIYYMNKMYTYDNKVKETTMENARTIRAIGKSLQPYPSSECLVPYQMPYKVEELTKTANSITVKLPEPVSQFGCAKFNLPATLYTIYVTSCFEDNLDNCDNDERLTFKTYDQEAKLENLKPFTKYKFTLILSNYYIDVDNENQDLLSGVILRTGAGAPTKPENVTVQPLTPTLAAVHWMPPKILNAEAVRYEVHWRSVRLVNGVRPKAEQLIKHTERPKDGRFSAMLNSLLPGHEYLVYVRAYPAHFNDTYSESEEQALKMFPEPNNLTLSNVTVSAMNISWILQSDLISTYALHYTVVGLEKWQVASNFTQNESKVDFYLQNLQSKTLYKFRLVLKYKNYSESFTWPDDGRFFTFQTLGDVPSAPGVPMVTKLRNSVFQLIWEPAQAHGSPITLYRLEGKLIDDLDNPKNINNQSDDWMLYYNGTDNYWIIFGDMNHKYRFRVQARNAYGFGTWSKESTVIDLADNNNAMLAAHQHLGLTLGLSVPVIIIMLLCFCYIICPVYRKRKEDKKTILNPIISDVELATLREIPRGNFVQSNALYASAIQNDSDDSMLPKIRRDQITLAKFLGSGAFGEVFQGNAKDLDGPGITPVAIKTLRKGATSQEKTEFLQEARLMSHFRHKHVLRLLGVCLDTDPPLLVLELMEAGDLLSYLRASRSLAPTAPNALRLQDLLAMCEDVARGCQYLEELHFVHRDLACRNCLVSARDRENRVVKIGDFGLARDIYKNDYYRKEGEGLLPVRWMAPESLVDGVFTSQSDVWAFGVLMWEITSLGQQPYPARTNLEVLHHVRAGGRLLKPLNCPPALHQLMLQCWSAADARPSFKIILEKIIHLRKNTEDVILSPVHAGHYLARRGVSNMAYFADENQNHNSGNSFKSSSSEGSRDLQPFLHDSQATTAVLQSTEVPKYLELLADNEEFLSLANSINGYEVPRSICFVGNNNTVKSDELKNPEISSSLKLETDILNQTDLQDKQINFKRSSITSLDLMEYKRTSIYSIGKKCKTLDNLKTSISSPSSKSNLNKDSLTSLSDSQRYKKNVIGQKESETSLEASNGSITSSTSLTQSNRPSSSSLINSHNTTQIANGNVDTVNCNINNSKAILSKALKTHSSLQNAKANIPLVINNALLNLLKQAPNVDDNTENIVTYTNVNADTLRVNGS